MTVQTALVAMNGSVRNALADWFRLSIPGCRVRHAARADEAVALGRQYAPSVIVTQDGGTRVPIVQTIRAMRASLNAPIIVLTQSDYTGHWGQRICPTLEHQRQPAGRARAAANHRRRRTA